MTGKPTDEAVLDRACEAYAEIAGDYMGFVRRKAMSAALTVAQQRSDGEVIQRHVVTKYSDGSVQVSDVTAPPPSAPVGALGQQSGAVAPTTAECPHDWGQDEAHEDWARCYKCGISRRKPLDQQTAAVDGDFINRIADSLIEKGWDIDPNCDGTGVAQLREAVISVLAAQPGGSDNDR